MFQPNKATRVHPYKPGLIRTLVDRAYQVKNTWLGFHEDITKLIKILQQNLFLVHAVANVKGDWLEISRIAEKIRKIENPETLPQERF